MNQAVASTQIKVADEKATTSGQLFFLDLGAGRVIIRLRAQQGKALQVATHA